MITLIIIKMRGVRTCTMNSLNHAHVRRTPTACLSEQNYKNQAITLFRSAAINTRP